MQIAGNDDHIPYGANLYLTFKAKITPPHRLEDLRSWKCIYGVSIGSRNKSIHVVRGGYRWAVDHFTHCSILLGDSLYRITLQIQNGLEPSLASSTAAAAGDAVLADLLAGPYANADVIRCSEIMDRLEFGSVLEEIKVLHEGNGDFRESITSDALMFVDRQSRQRRLAVNRENALDLAVHYLHEEIAVYLVLAREGWLVDVYLGDELPTLERITAGQIICVPDVLKRRVNVALRVKLFL